MDTAANCVFNLTRNTVLSSKVTVADAHEPLRVLVLVIDKLGVDSGSAVWLTPLPGTPGLPRLFSFDLVYLDRQLRIVDCVAVTPGVDLPAFSRQVTSALVLPERAISLSHTQRGDQLRIEAETKTDRESATSFARDGVNGMQAADFEPVAQSAPELRGPDEPTRVDLAKSTEPLFEPFPSPLIYVPAINAANRPSPNSSEKSFREPLKDSARIESREELPITVPTWALQSSIGELIESAGSPSESPQAVAPLEQVETQSAPESAPLVAPIAQDIPIEVPQTPLNTTNSADAAPTQVGNDTPNEPVMPNEPKGLPLSLNCVPIAPEPISPNMQFTWAQSHGWLLSNHTAGAPKNNGEKTLAQQRKETKPDVQETAEPPKMAAPLNISQPVTEPAKLPEPDSPEPWLPFPPDPVEWPDQRRSLATRIQRWLDADLPADVIGPVDRRRGCRIHKPNLVAFYWSGGMPKPHCIADISATGVSLLLQPDDRWIPQTILRITLQRTDWQEERSGHSITVLARVVRAGSDAVGHQFVMEEKLNRHFREILPYEGTDKEALELFLAPLQH
jgi:hypothetical protein